MKIHKIIAAAIAICTAVTFGMPSDAGLRSNAIDLDNIDIDVDASLENQYKFTLKNDGTYEITEYIREPEENPVFTPSPDIYLPKSYKGKPVTSIGARAFNTNNFDHITGTVNIPPSITSIGDYAFWMGEFSNCNIPETVTSIGIQAFDNTPYLENMRKKDPVVIINNILVDAKTASGDVVLPNTLTTIPGYAFYENESVESVYIPDTVRSIGKYAFSGCSSLKKVNIPNSITEISGWAFKHCEKLSGALTIPSSVKTIGDGAFWSCSGLSSINIENGVTYIGGSAFKFCMSVTDVSIPGSVKTIEGCAFSENRQLKKIVIPASVGLIGQGCFRYCYSLDSVTIMNPECVIYDDDDTFPYYTDILGIEDSTAHNYAKKYDRTFKSFDSLNLYGDADGDGKITANDASLVLTEYAALSAGKAAFTAKQTALADVDGDGKITANDASNILMFYAYLSGNGTETDIKIWLNNLS